jgi:hypothetical protein
VNGKKYHITSFISLLGAPKSPFAPNDAIVSSRHSNVRKREASPALARFRLNTQPGRDALRELKVLRRWRLPLTKGNSAQMEFRARVLEFLARIEKTRSGKAATDPYKAAVAVAAKKLKRRAERVRRLADELERPVAVRMEPPFPALELRSYANKLSAFADWYLRGGAFAPPSGSSVVRTRRPPRQTPKEETRHILRLVQFVRERTGQTHWDELAILLQLATGNPQYKKHRLQSLTSWHSKRQKSLRAAGLFIL